VIEAVTADSQDPRPATPADEPAEVLLGRVEEVPRSVSDSDPPTPVTGPSGHVGMDGLGARLKELRKHAGLSLRELARQTGVSPSLVSQIENGKSRPSVSTLYSFARLLNVPVDELFEADASALTNVPVGEGPHDPANAWHLSEYATRISVIHPSHRAHLHMEEGVEWERLAATPERDVNFMKITYAPGAASTEGGAMTHDGYEYGYVLSGVLEVTVGNEVFVLREGESLGFDSTIPHVFRNIGETDFQGIWFVHGRQH
jgi:Predicted transcriptional regulators